MATETGAGGIAHLLKEYPPQHKQGCQKTKDYTPCPTCGLVCQHYERSMARCDRCGKFFSAGPRDCTCGLDEALASLRAAATPEQIDCPLCGEVVKQVSSATLSLALWQHVNWMHCKGCDDDLPHSHTCREATSAPAAKKGPL